MTDRLARGQLFHRPEVGFTQRATVSLHLIGWWGSGYEAPIFLVTNMSSPYQACPFIAPLPKRNLLL